MTKFNDLLKQKPTAGTTLRSKDGSPVPLFVDNREHDGKARRVMFANALIDEEATGWYLADSTRGLKCLILPEHQRRLIEENGGSEEGLTVLELRVVRQNDRQTALICEL